MLSTTARPVSRPARARHTWLRLLLAAFVLALYTSLALAAGGVARADGDSSDSSASNADAKTSQQSDPAKSPAAADTPSHAAPKTNIGSTSADESTADSSPDDTEKPTSTAQSGDSPVLPATAPEEPSVETEPHKANDTGASNTALAELAELATLEPSERPKPSSHPMSVPSPAAVSSPAAVEPSEAITIAPSQRRAAAPVETEPTNTFSAVAAAITPSNPGSVDAPQLGLQVAGLASDVATVAVSAIHTVATSVAQAFGPDSFLGVPYLLATTVANAAAAVGRTLVGAPMITPSAGPFAVEYGILDGLAFFNPTNPPAGANDPSLTVTPEHPLPIILLNGTTTTQGINWSVGAPVLANAGYKVYTFNYGNTTSNPNFPIQAMGDVRLSALELSAEVDRVLAETGAEKVILIGHSQGGGILPVHYINNLGGADKVSQLIGISPSNHGTDLNYLIALQSLPILGPLVVDFADALGPALYQQALGSPFQQEVYGNGDTRAGVLYTTIASMNDEIVTPYTQQALDGPDVTNIVLQDRYPGLVIGHANVIVSPHTWGLVLEALASNSAANPVQILHTVAA